jgi:hypothetical protein
MPTKPKHLHRTQATWDKQSTFCRIIGWKWCHRAFWRGLMVCYIWKTVHLQPLVDKKYLDGSYRCKNVTGANYHSRGFVGWTDSVGQNWMDSLCLLVLQFSIIFKGKLSLHLIFIFGPLIYINQQKIDFTKSPRVATKGFRKLLVATWMGFLKLLRWDNLKNV